MSWSTLTEWDQADDEKPARAWEVLASETEGSWWGFLEAKRRKYFREQGVISYVRSRWQTNWEEYWGLIFGLCWVVNICDNSGCGIVVGKKARFKWSQELKGEELVAMSMDQWEVFVL